MTLVNTDNLVSSFSARERKLPTYIELLLDARYQATITASTSMVYKCQRWTNWIYSVRRQESVYFWQWAVSGWTWARGGLLGWQSCSVPWSGCSLPSSWKFPTCALYICMFFCMCVVLHKTTLQWISISSQNRKLQLSEGNDEWGASQSKWVVEIETQVSQTPEPVSWLLHCPAFVDSDNTLARGFIIPIRTIANTACNG